MAYIVMAYDRCRGVGDAGRVGTRRRIDGCGPRQQGSLHGPGGARHGQAGTEVAQHGAAEEERGEEAGERRCSAQQARLEPRHRWWPHQGRPT